MVAIGGVVAKPVDIDRPAADAGRSAPVRQNGLNLGSLIKPSFDGLRLLVGVCLKIDLSNQALIQPFHEGLAKALYHRAHANVCRERQQERHQREGQAGQLLPTVGPEPFRERKV